MGFQQKSWKSSSRWRLVGELKISNRFSNEMQPLNFITIISVRLQFTSISIHSYLYCDRLPDGLCYNIRRIPRTLASNNNCLLDFIHLSQMAKWIWFGYSIFRWFPIAGKTFQLSTYIRITMEIVTSVISIQRKSLPDIADFKLHDNLPTARSGPKNKISRKKSVFLNKMSSQRSSISEISNIQNSASFYSTVTIRF